jgi:hypothetical protein
MSNHRRSSSRPKSSGLGGGAYTISRMIKPGALIKSKHTSYRKVRDQKVTRSFASRQTKDTGAAVGGHRTYNYARNQRTMDIESLNEQSSASNRYPSRGGFKGEYELAGNRTFGAERALKKTL